MNLPHKRNIKTSRNRDEFGRFTLQILIKIFKLNGKFINKF